jgi:hypothetical protein
VLTGGSFVSQDGVGNFLPVLASFLPGGGPTAPSFPFAFVHHLASDLDPGQALYARSRWRVYVVAGSGGGTAAAGASQPIDDHGEAALIGWTRAATQGQGKSTGRAADEVAGRLIEAIFTARGSTIDSTHAIQARVIPVDRLIAVDGMQVVARPFELEVYNATVARRYHVPKKLRATGGVGQVSLTWSLPPTRFDTLSVILRRAAGATAPATVTDGTGVTLASALATSVTDSGLAAGTYSYSLFAAYDETTATPTTADRYSSPATATSVTVT